jgi:hypothetical protein
MLFIDYSAAFNTTVPSKLIIKLGALGLHPALCNWVQDFLTDHPQVVKVGNNTSTLLILITGAPQGWVLSPLLYSLFTHDCLATHASNSIIRFVEYTTAIGLITQQWKQQREQAPIHIDGTEVEKVESFKFLRVHITDNLKWTTHTDSVVKKAQKRIFNGRRLKKFGLACKTLTNFY